MKTKKVTHTFISPFNFTSLFVACGMLLTTGLMAQSAVYDNFDGLKTVRYTEKAGVLDSLAKNPAPDAVNGSAKCGFYVRNGTKKFDVLKMGLPANLTEVDKYATYLGVPPKFKLKVYTTAPVGTLVEVLLGNRKGNNDYPSGTHSQYQAYTKVSNQWEELEFLFSQIPQGSQTSASQIDQVVLMFNPNSSTSDSYYFDDLTGPPIGSPGNNAANMGDGQGSSPNTEAVNTNKPQIDPGTTTPEKTPKKSKKSKK